MKPQDSLFEEEYHPMPESGLCSRCGMVVPNSVFFKRSSQHFQGKCKPKPILDDTFYYELQHRRPRGSDWRYAPPGSLACRRYYA